MIFDGITQFVLPYLDSKILGKTVTILGSSGMAIDEQMTQGLINDVLTYYIGDINA